MTIVTNFMKLTAPGRRRLRMGTARIAAALTLTAAVLLPSTVLAKAKVSADLQAVVTAGTATSNGVWINTSTGIPYIKVVIASSGVDPEMTDLRAAVLANGGSVFARYYAVSALSAMLPLDKVATIASRTDVTGVTPNRTTARTASLLETQSGTVTGAATGPRLYSGSAYSGLDGSGVGIAVLDSGVSASHAAMKNAAGTQTRVSRAVNMLLAGDAPVASAVGSTANWTPGVDLSTSL